MSGTQFIEAFSTDPFVRDIHRRALAYLNDPSMDRKERETQIRRLQALLVDHQRTESTQADKLADKTAVREQASRLTGNKSVAPASQITARRREFAAVIRGQ